MELEYQLSNGRWTACEDRNQEFLDRAIAFNKTLMPDEIMQKLNSGREMRTGTDWYDFIRGKEITQKLNESLEKSMARLNFNKYETVEEFDARLDEQ